MIIKVSCTTGQVLAQNSKRMVCRSCRLGPGCRAHLLTRAISSRYTDCVCGRRKNQDIGSCSMLQLTLQQLISVLPTILAHIRTSRRKMSKSALRTVEDCRTRASRPPQTHCRYKAVDGPSSRYTAQSTLPHPISSRTTSMPASFVQSLSMWSIATPGVGWLLYSDTGPFRKTIRNPFCVGVIEHRSTQEVAWFAVLIVNPGIVPSTRILSDGDSHLLARPAVDATCVIGAGEPADDIGIVLLETSVWIVICEKAERQPVNPELRTHLLSLIHI